MSATRREFRLLGELQVLTDGVPLPLPGGRQRPLVALLVVHAGEHLRSERIVEALWGEDPPAHPDNAVQQRILAVRRLLDPSRTEELVRTVPGGYRLDVPDEAIDARRFERLAETGRAQLARGDHQAASDTLGEALALWRGAPLADIDAPFAREEARRLDELRLTARERRFDAELGLGRHLDVVTELEQLVDAHPLRERLRGQLMLALAGSGRQADALQRYTEARELLRDELGIDPSPRLREIHRHVLEQRQAPPAPETAPAAAAAAAPRSAVPPLPRPASSFVGRDEELARVVRLLATERLVTLTGPGGAGKSRLALEAAHVVRARSPGRACCLAELGGVVEPDTVASTLLSALGTDASRDLPVAAALHAVLGSRPVLLVIDGCEHLLAEVAPLIQELVTSHEQLHVLATSREPLGVDGEVVWPVPTLPVPTRTGRGSCDPGGSPAVQLFTDRLRAVVPDHPLDAADLDAIGRIVRRLDGLPLAIELAAARSRALSLPDLDDHLHDRFRVLADHRGRRPDRHRTLLATLTWSWELLDDALRLALLAAAVPAGAFTGELFASLLAALEVDLDPLEALTGLCDRSLLAVHERGTPTRYRMLESIRAFGAQQLAGQPAEATLRAAHARAVEAVITQADRTDPDRWDVDLATQRQWLPEARAALRWRLSAGEAPGAQRLAAGLGWVWLLGALAPEGLRWLDLGLGPPDELRPDGAVPAAVQWAATLRLSEEPGTPGLRWARLAVAATQGDPVQHLLAQVASAGHLALAGDQDAARRLLDEQPTDGSWREGYLQLALGQLATLQGRLADAEQHLERSEQLLVDHGAWWGVWTAATRVQLAQLRGDGHAVLRIVEQALPTCERWDATKLEVDLRAVLAMVAADLAEQGLAEEQLTRTRELAEHTGLATLRALHATAEGYVRLRGDDLAGARTALEAALTTDPRRGLAFARPFARWALAQVMLRQGDPDMARTLLVASLQEAAERGELASTAIALEGLAEALLAHDAPLAARMLGAAEARRAQLATHLPVIGGAEARRTGQRLRVQLDDLDAHRSAGRELSDEQLLALVGAGTRRA